jgi:uncharacterized spore protein YtfJ
MSIQTETSTSNGATEKARKSAENQPLDQLVERLAERIGARASVEAVFGEPITRGDLTVIPVARVRWGFGGGGGHSDASPTGAASGSGGGGGVAANPIGYLEIRQSSAAFQPIRDQYPSPVLLLAAGATAAIVVRALARLRRP